MAHNKGTDEPRIHQITPAETKGRDTIARFQAQFRAAAYECLSILTGKTIDRVYCDYQDDFVSRQPKVGKPIYHFYQVKTKAKRNFQWGKLDVFGLPKRQKPKPGQMAGSFVGKLMFHTIKFKNSCGNVVFLTNVQLDDELEDVASALENGDLSNEILKTFMERFNEAFIEEGSLDPGEIKTKVGKLLLKPGIEYLHPQADQFEALARDAIFDYSEIDLQHAECEEIIRNLVALVEKKSFKKLVADLSESELDDLVGVGISDLLEILSISKGAYQQLLAGGDANAIKSASIIQRKLTQAGASADLVEYSCRWKVQWDVWFRDKRHMLPEFDLNFLLASLNAIKNRWTSGQIAFADIEGEVNGLWTKLSGKGLTATLTKNLLIGGVFSALVRSEAQ